MPRRLHAPGCLLAVLSLVAPHTAGVAYAEPVSDDAVAAPSEPEAAQDSAGDAPEAGADAASKEPEATAERPTAAESPEPEPEDETASESPEPEPEPDDGELDDDGDLDDGELDDVAPTSTLPDRLPRLQRIGWYHVLGAFTLGTTAGLLAGLAEREEDKATRIASGYDLETGGSLLYADRQEAYERSLDRGQALETSAIVVGAVAGVTAIVAITLFAVDAKRRPSSTARRTRIGPGSLEVSF